MFALPGIALLTVFILARPQEFIPELQRVPFLHLFTALAVIGYIIDLRLRRLQPIATNSLPWVAAFLLWAVISTGLNAADAFIPRLLEMAILFALWGTISHAVQRFRTFQFVAGVLCATCTFIAVVCLHQGMAEKQCIGGEEKEGAIEGKPDGRPCENTLTCYARDDDEGMEYRCEHVGLFGTYSVEDRVRYRGELQDPNEVALTICSGGMAILIGFALRTRRRFSKLVLYGGVGAVIATVFLTQSRGGLLAAMLVPAVYLVRKYGLKVLVPAAVVALPVVLMASRSGEAADISTAMRYDAWATGLDMWKSSPIYGVGARMFSLHHFLAAHNAYLLSLAELGIVGFTLFLIILYLAVKTLVVGNRALSSVPGTEAARVWSLALLAALFGVLFQINTLSFTYHPVLWMLLGLIGAWYSAVRHHMPELEIKVRPRELVAITIVAILYATLILPMFLKIKGYM